MSHIVVPVPGVLGVNVKLLPTPAMVVGIVVEAGKQDFNVIVGNKLESLLATAEVMARETPVASAKQAVLADLIV